MSQSISTLRPGLLVSLKSSITGNVQYRTVDIEPDHLDETGARKARWETDRTIENPEEHEAAIRARSKARGLITAVCSGSSFGLLCPQAKEAELSAGIDAARAVINTFNETATITRISLYSIVGRVASDDVEAVRAINSEVSDLLAEVERGLQRLDVKAVREAANKATELSAVLSPSAAARVADAITLARSAARKIVKAGEAASIEIDEITLERIRQSRTAFLDIDPATEMKAPEVTSRAIDLGAIDEVSAASIFSPALEF